MTAREHRQAALQALADARRIWSEAGDNVTEETRTAYDRALNDHHNHLADAHRLENLEDAERRMAEPTTEPSTLAPGTPNPPETETRTAEETAELEERAFMRYMQTGQVAPELRAIQADNDTAGGFVVMPQQLQRDILADMDAEFFVRSMANVISMTQAESLGQVTLDTDVDDFSWTTEIAEADEDTSLAFGKRELRPHPVRKLIKISKKLLRSSFLDMAAYVRGRCAYKIGYTQETAFLTGSGSGQPLGVFTASDDGIGTARDVTGDNTTTEIAVTTLKDMKYSIKGQYWADPSFAWLFHRDAVKQLAKLQDGNGRFLWEDSIVRGDPSRLLGAPVYMSEIAPSTFTSGLYVGVLGVWKYYWIVDALTMQVQRLVELYSRNNQDGFLIDAEADGQPVKAEAFARCKLA